MTWGAIVAQWCNRGLQSVFSSEFHSTEYYRNGWPVVFQSRLVQYDYLGPENPAPAVLFEDWNTRILAGNVFFCALLVVGVIGTFEFVSWRYSKKPRRIRLSDAIAGLTATAATMAFHSQQGSIYRWLTIRLRQESSLAEGMSLTNHPFAGFDPLPWDISAAVYSGIWCSAVLLCLLAMAVPGQVLKGWAARDRQSRSERDSRLSKSG